jgi:L-alanine-DL-glutamate epimerase-like enolase superfamily enzyme
MQVRFASFPFPFRTRFEHAAASRDRAENVIVIAEDGAGRTGLGEGCPRDYVTGETVHTALAALTRWLGDGADAIDDLAGLTAWMLAHVADIDRNPSAFAALELALLDVLARRAEQTLEQHLGIPVTAVEIRTSAVYGTRSTAKLLAQIALYTLNGMGGDAKLKLTGDSRIDRARARVLAGLGRLRLDANNLWPSAAEACRGLDGTSRHAWAVEEPLRPRDWRGLAEVGARTGLALVLDESATHPLDLDALVPGPRYVVNVRVSKLGGLLRALAMIEAARARGYGVIVGAQVGETSILARAGIAAAHAAGSALIGFEAAFGTRLLARDATVPALRFGRGGRVDVSGLGALGSGLTPTREVDGGCVTATRPAR